MDVLKHLGLIALASTCIGGCLPADTPKSNLMGTITEATNATPIENIYFVLNSNNFKTTKGLRTSIGTVSNVNGLYSYTQQTNGIYSITPISDVNHFKPPKRTIAVSGTAIAGLNFVRYQYQLWYADQDEDGYGDPNTLVDAETNPSDVNLQYVENDTDCRPEDADINPGETDIADDDIDQDCDGLDLQTWYADQDSDGTADKENIKKSGLRPSRHITVAGDIDLYLSDCNDFNAAIHPGATELPDNNIDDDCDGIDLKTWYVDTDNDGYGHRDDAEIFESDYNPNVTPSDNYVDAGNDCNPSDPLINPAAIEIADNTIDENCDGHLVAIWHLDGDGDGYGDESISSTTLSSGYVAITSSKPADCDDGDKNINTGAKEIADDKVDQNCDGLDLLTWYSDTDNDGYGDDNNTTLANKDPSAADGTAPYVLKGGDCAVDDVAVNPGAIEDLDNSIDDNCDGYINVIFWYADEDEDGFGDRETKSPTPQADYVTDDNDCNDSDPKVNPGAIEITADGIDQDCSGLDSLAWYKDEDEDGYGKRTDTLKGDNQPEGYVANGTDCEDNDATMNPAAPEIAGNEFDEDCDGYPLLNWYFDRDGDEYGDSAISTEFERPQLNYVKNSTDCNDADASINPIAADIPGDDIDSNCDGNDF